MPRQFVIHVCIQVAKKRIEYIELITPLEPRVPSMFKGTVHGFLGKLKFAFNEDSQLIL